ncbi:Na+/proline symporter [Alteromonadaceae bacterium Bs31]|nr:Na+/proline symporter [Alteromonadaceae bacterium Bs31]
MSAIILIVGLVVYLAALFLIARLADRRRFSHNGWVRHPLVYALALGVYCTSWTFYGLVGTAASSGWYYLPILLGPILLFLFGFPVLLRIAAICRQEHIHSLADFLSSRYGKRQSVAVVVTLLVLVATIPYIALQLKAVTNAILVSAESLPFASEDLTLLVAGCMTAFTLLFGANRLDVSSYHSGIMVAIAFESLIKLIALGAIALFAWLLSQGFDTASLPSTVNSAFSQSTVTPSFWVLTLVSACSIFCLPRMFQVTFVECLSEKHLRFARKAFTGYMLAIAAAVFVIAWVGNQFFFDNSINGDHYVLALPLANNNKTLVLLGFIGGFSAATAMIIVATLTLSQMLSNDVILPLVIRSQKNRGPVPDYSGSLKITRRLTVVAVVGLAWLYQHSLAENVPLTDIGLIAFALVVQLAPAILFGLYWQGSNVHGVYAGLAVGSSLLFYCLMLPLLAQAGFISSTFIEHGPFGISLLKPASLLGFNFSDTYTQGIVLSLLANAAALVWFSRKNQIRLADKIQAHAFVHSEAVKQDKAVHNLQINLEDLQSLLVQFLGHSSTDRLLESYVDETQTFASDELVSQAERALSGVIGVASTRAMLLSLKSGDRLGVADVVNIFEETTRTLQFNQDMLFASFESISSAISVVNAELEMVAWNRRYEQMFNYPEGMLYVGKSVAELVRFNAERGMLGSGSVEQHVETRLQHLTAGKAYRVVRTHNDGVIEIKGRPLPKGGYVTTYDDISEFIRTQNELEKVNENLEQRVEERTRQIEEINQSLRKEIEKRQSTETALLEAKSLAESANANKTQFLAIASHDILQPLNAANLYASALLEKSGLEKDLGENLQHLHNAIASAEFIISSLLEIARLDTGTLKASKCKFALADILEPLANEFRVQTEDDVEFRWQQSKLWTHSDPKYLRRILQNFLSNAVKYTNSGKILLGCRPCGKHIKIGVYDNGPGISDAQQARIFDDFYRIEKQTEGAGLGLGIALRFAQLLDHSIELSSKPGRGSVFQITVPLVEPGSAKEQALASNPLQSSLQGLQIFYIDDDENNLRALQTLMQNWGCYTETAASANAALAAVAKIERPGAILVDYQLGEGLNGIQLASKIREHWQNIPICIVSAAPDEELQQAKANMGIDFLRKPIKPNKLRALLERYQQKHDQSQSET